MGTQPRLEKDLKKSAKDLLDTLPKCWYFKVNTMVIKGIPDIIGVVNGRFFAWELKREKLGRTTKLQRLTLAMIARAGGHVRIVDDSVLEEAFQDLKALSK